MVKNNRSSKSYEERLQALTPKNRSFVERFLRSEKGNEKSYKSQTFIFVEHFNHTIIDQIEPDEIENYLSNIDGEPAHIVNVAHYLTFFLNLIPLQEENISRLTKVAREKQKEIKNKEPISLKDVITFRNKLIFDQNTKARFVFEMLYVYGFDWKDFKNIKEYSPTTGELTIKNKGTFKVTDDLRILLNNNPEILTPKSYGVLSGYLRDASTIFEKSVNETVIEATRTKYFPICQRCNNQYPNTSEYWALVECKDDTYHKKWLLCLSCAKEVGGKW